MIQKYLTPLFLKARVGLLVFLTSCSHAEHSSNRITIHDLIPDFLKNVCSQSTHEGFVSAWLKYEEKNWDFFEALFYQNEELKAERLLIAEKLKNQRNEICKHTQSFSILSKDLIEPIGIWVATLMNQKIEVDLYLVSALQWTDGRGDRYKDKDVYVLNGRIDTFSVTSRLVSTLAHELIHSAQSARWKEQQKKLSPVARSLYREGGAVFGVIALYPELGKEAVGISQEDLGRAEKSVSTVSADLLKNWDSMDLKILNKYFSGGFKDKKIPRKMGYYLGLLIYQKLAKESSAIETVRMSPEVFQEKAKEVLSVLKMED